MLLKLLLKFFLIISRFFCRNLFDTSVYLSHNFLKVIPEEVWILFTLQSHVKKWVDWTYCTIIVLIVKLEAKLTLVFHAQLDEVLDSLHVFLEGACIRKLHRVNNLSSEHSPVYFSQVICDLNLLYLNLLWLYLVNSWIVLNYLLVNFLQLRVFQRDALLKLLSLESSDHASQDARDHA